MLMPPAKRAQLSPGQRSVRVHGPTGLRSVSTANSRRSAATRCPGLSLALVQGSARERKAAQRQGRRPLTSGGRGPPAKVGSQLRVEEEAGAASDAGGSRIDQAEVCRKMPKTLQSQQVLSAHGSWLPSFTPLVNKTESIGLGSICQILKHRQQIAAEEQRVQWSKASAQTENHNSSPGSGERATTDSSKAKVVI